MNQRESFNNAAQLYDEARLSCPDEVIDRIISTTKITTDKTLLEIGAGTGQATMKFAEKGFRIRCIEMGSRLAEVLMQKAGHYNVTVNVSSFEEWEPAQPFRTPFVFSATAFHWIEKDIKYKKCRDLLDDGGYLVLLWNVAPEIELPAFRKARDLLLKYYPEERNAQRSKADVIIERQREIVDSGFFNLDHYFEYEWNSLQTRERFTKGFLSQLLFLSLKDESRKELSVRVIDLFKELDDEIESEIYTTVYIARKEQEIGSRH